MGQLFNFMLVSPAAGQYKEGMHNIINPGGRMRSRIVGVILWAPHFLLLVNVATQLE